MAQSNHAPGGGKHGIEVLRDPEINKSTNLTERIENMSTDNTYPSRFWKARRTLVARLILFVLLTLPLAACNAVAVGTATAGTPPSSAVVSAIQTVIQRGNQEEQQAVAAHDPTLMRDTSTTTYYNQIVQAFNDLVNSGVTAIKLTNLIWGPITLQ